MPNDLIILDNFSLTMTLFKIGDEIPQISQHFFKQRVSNLFSLQV